MNAPTTLYRFFNEKVGTVRMWFYRGKLPAATVVLVSGHVWLREEIESWINDRKGETTGKGRRDEHAMHDSL